MSLPSPSALPRLSQCLAGEVLPHVEHVSPAASRGTVIHQYLADVLEFGVAEALERAPEDMRFTLSCIDDARLPAFHPGEYAPEVSLAYDPETGLARYLGKMLSRQDARSLARPYELVGTLDVAGGSADSVVVYDYKSGWTPVDEPGDNWQLKTYALFLARALKRRQAEVGIIRVTGSGGVVFDVAELSASDLDEHEAALRDLLQRRAGVRADPTKAKYKLGSHCRFCPAQVYCPAHVELMRQVLGGPSWDLNDDAAAVEAWTQLRAARTVLERWEALVDNRLRRRPVHLPDGSVLGEKLARPRESLIPHRVEAVVAELYGPELAAAVATAVERTEKLPKEAFKRALSKFVLPTRKGERLSDLERDVMHRLRKTGGVTNTPTTPPVCIHRPKALPQQRLEGAEDAALA